MTVEMIKDGDPALAAFEWPAIPEDLSPWGSQRQEDGVWRNTAEKRNQSMKENNDLLVSKQDEKAPEDWDKVRIEAARKRREAREREEEELEASRREAVMKEEGHRVKRKAKLREIG